MPSIGFENVGKRYNDEFVLRGLTAKVSPGRCLALVGENGSGKTVALRCLCGLSKLDEGEILVDGASIGKDIDFPPSLGFLIESPALINRYSALDNLLLVAQIKGIVTQQDAARVLERLGLDPTSKRRVQKYSLGMRQRVGIALVLMEQPDLLVLDEPTNALDAEGIDLLTNILHEEMDRGATLIITSHDAEFIKNIATDVVYLRAGRMVEGPAK